MTVNQALSVDQCPLIKPEDLFTIANGHKFTELELSQVYSQLQLEKSSRSYVRLNTQQGYTQLKFAAPVIFHKLTDTALQ